MKRKYNKVRRIKVSNFNKVILVVLCCLSLLYWYGRDGLKNIYAATTVTITNPTAQTNVPETLDFATEAYSDPWDMSEITDVAGAGTHQIGISGLNATDGLLSGTAVSNDPSFFLVHPATFESIPMGKDGLLHPINTNDYSNFSVRMYASQDTWIQVYWFYNQQWTSFGVENYYISAGWGTYDIDLSSNPDWTGSPIGLRFDPATQPGVNFSVDWAKLRKTGTAQNKMNVQWTDSSPGGWATLWLDNDNTPGNGGEIYKGAKTSIANNTYEIDLAEIQFGTYYVYISKGGQNSASQAFNSSQPPAPVVLDPDFAGGTDYATTVSGDPWDMSQLSDLYGSMNIAGLNSNGSVVSGVTSNSDPLVYLRVPTPIDTGKYHRLSFRFKYDGAFSLMDGTMTRFLWNRNGTNSQTYQTSQDIVTYPDWTTYYIDLKTSELDSGTEGWAGNVNLLRFDPLETVTNRNFYLDDIKLAEDDKSNGSYDIKWKDNSTSSLPTTVKLYYDTNNSGFNGTLIAEGISQQAGINTYTWDTGAVPTGLYHIYIESTDGYNTSRAYSTGPVSVSNNYDYWINSAVNPPSAMSAAGTTSVQVHLRNTGSNTWYNEAQYNASPTTRKPMRLAVLNADGKTFWPNNDTWVGNERIAMTSPTVAPGQIGTFSFTMRAPTTPGYHTLRFMPVVEGVQALKDIGMQFGTSIGYDYWINSAVNPPSVMTTGNTALVQVHLRNTGISTWYNEGAYNASPSTRRPMRLAVLNADGQNFFPNNDTWVGNSRIAMTSASVAPGQIGSFNFTIRAPAPGYHTLRFIPVVEGVQALRDIGMQFGVTAQ